MQAVNLLQARASVHLTSNFNDWICYKGKRMAIHCESKFSWPMASVIISLSYTVEPSPLSYPGFNCWNKFLTIWNTYMEQWTYHKPTINVWNNERIEQWLFYLSIVSTDEFLAQGSNTWAICTRFSCSCVKINALISDMSPCCRLHYYLLISIFHHIFTFLAKNYIYSDKLQYLRDCIPKLLDLLPSMFTTLPAPYGLPSNTLIQF